MCTMSESTSSSSTPSALRVLRQKLQSVAWVQCDNLSCLKWRKIDREEAEKLADSTPWQCSMNRDSNFNSCDVEQENTEHYDNLAKKAKLSIIKSELKPGSLVWAKMSGYCSWPAVITRDPANDEYWDGDEIEIVWYHVEFIGGQHCHSWVRANYVETFGLDKSVGSFEIKQKRTISSNTQKKRKTKRKKPLLTDLKKYYRKEKTTYNGLQTLKAAYREALKLLPLSAETRLKTCVFKSETLLESQKQNQKTRKQRTNRVRKQKRHCGTSVSIDESLKSKLNERSLKRTQQRRTRQNRPTQFTPRETVVQNSPIVNCLKSKATDESSHVVQPIQTATDDEELDKGEEEEQSSCPIRLLSRLEPFFNFSSSLIDVSKETRLLADTERYRSQWLVFEGNLAKFYSNHGVPRCRSPVWCQLKIDLFEFFLIILERGGFTVVSSSRQWSNVFQELTNQYSKDGGSKTKAFYKKNLYPYELYIQGMDYVGAMEELMKKRPAKPRNEDEGLVDSSHIDDENDLMKELEELDEILQAAFEDTLLGENKDPATDFLHERSTSDSQSSSRILDLEGSQSLFGLNIIAEERNRGIFALTLPSLPLVQLQPSMCMIENVSQVETVDYINVDDISEDWTLHELQLLENSFEQSCQ